MNHKYSVWKCLKQDYKKHKIIYLIALPIVIYYLVFHYAPMFGLVIAFKDYRPARGIWKSAWIGFDNFKEFFGSYYFWTLLRNTLKISLTSILLGFPAPIILALFLNEVRNKGFKKVVQTITYMPHFISIVVMAGIIVDMVESDGVVNQILALFGAEKKNLLMNGNLFLPIYIISDIWQHIGWGTIIYLSALAGIPLDLYEAADIDGAGRFKKMWHVTLPGLAPAIVTLLILRIGSIMSVGWEKIILLYNPATYAKADVISSFVYRMGIENNQQSYASAVGLFNSVINFALLYFANRTSRKVNDMSLW